MHAFVFCSGMSPSQLALRKRANASLLPTQSQSYRIHITMGLLSDMRHKAKTAIATCLLTIPLLITNPSPILAAAPVTPLTSTSININVKTQLNSNNNPELQSANRAIAIQLYNLIRSYYYDFRAGIDLDQDLWQNQAMQFILPHEMDQQGIFGSQESTHAFLKYMVNSLHDPYSAFLTQEEFEQIKKAYHVIPDTPPSVNYLLSSSSKKMAANGKNGVMNPSFSASPSPLQSLSASAPIGGVGLQLDTIRIRAMGDGLSIMSPLPESPAEKAGIRPNDILMNIDGYDCTQLTINEALALLRGPPKSPVHLEIARAMPDGDVSLEFDLVRKTLYTLPATITKTFQTEDHKGKVGYIRLHTFNRVASTNLAFALKRFNGEGCNGVIVDVRGNAGGDPNEALACASMFISSDNTVLLVTEDADGVLHKHTVEDQNCISPGTLFPSPKPVILLTNDGSASSSEVLSVALRDNGRARIVGTPSFGKGIIQHLFPLEDGSALKLTVAEFISPKLTHIQGVGVQPDVFCSATPNLDDQGDPCILQAVDLIESSSKPTI